MQTDQGQPVPPGAVPVPREAQDYVVFEQDFGPFGRQAKGRRRVLAAAGEEVAALW